MRSPISKVDQLTNPCSSLTNTLETKNLSVSYNGVIAIEKASINIPPSAMMAVAGPNGAGKSSLVLAILNIVKRHSGSVFVNGHAFNKTQDALKYSISYVPQRSQVDWLFPVSVYDVVSMGLQQKLNSLKQVFSKKSNKSEINDKIFETLELVKMSDFAHRQIGQLSGGQQQRVFFARALISSPKLLILDEPFNGIDAPTSENLFELLKSTAKNDLTSILCIQHDMQTLNLFDLVTLINRKVIVSLPPEHALIDKFIYKTYSK